MAGLRTEPLKRMHHPHDPESDTMNLPDGCTCGDCVLFARCEAFLVRIPDDEVCDWYPSRFRLKVTAP